MRAVECSRTAHLPERSTAGGPGATPPTWALDTEHGEDGRATSRRPCRLPREHPACRRPAARVEAQRRRAREALSPRASPGTTGAALRPASRDGWHLCGTGLDACAATLGERAASARPLNGPRLGLLGMPCHRCALSRILFEPARGDLRALRARRTGRPAISAPRKKIFTIMSHKLALCCLDHAVAGHVFTATPRAREHSFLARVYGCPWTDGCETGSADSPCAGGQRSIQGRRHGLIARPPRALPQAASIKRSVAGPTPHWLKAERHDPPAA